MKFKKIFVTVGTTEFNDLIAKLAEPETYQVLKNDLGCEELTVQTGRGEGIDFSHFEGIKVETFGVKNSIADEIEAADLVISHAGAGTCIDVLSRGKFLLVVINDTLMHNHQTELAEQLAEDEYLFYTSVPNLHDALRTFDKTKLKTYEKGNVGKFIEYLDNAMGFTQ